MDLAKAAGNEIRERDLGLFDLYTADEVFVTGTAAEVAPVTKVDGRVVGDGKPGKITKDLMAAFKELARTTGTTIFK
jgi:branched-chain amino acid aminotransferase